MLFLILHESSSILDRQTTSAAAGLVGSSLTAIAATGFPGMETLMSNSNMNQNLETARRASTPTASTGNSGGFSSIFNLKSVISAATKGTQQQQQQQPAQTTSNSNFYVSPPITAFADQSESHQQSSSNISQKSVQGRLNRLFCCLC